jgi:hypothetical protein
MQVDNAMMDALLGRLAHHRDSVAVYRIRERRLDELEQTAVETAQRFVQNAGLPEMRYETVRGKDRTRILLQEGIVATLFHASGAVGLKRGWSPMSRMINVRAERADEEGLRRQAEDAVKGLRLAPLGSNEELRFERLWKLKAAGSTLKGERGHVVLTRAVGAFRRYLGGIPVWGRASAFVELAAGGEVAGAGVDWRPVAEVPIDETQVLAPEDAALRLLAELQSFLPGDQVSLKDHTPEFFALGYFSLPRRRIQAIMQPVYVGTFRPTGPIPSLGRLIVVPATPAAYEPICRPLAAPPQAAKKPVAAAQP